MKAVSDLLAGLVRAGKISENSFILGVDDGSRDRTWNIIAELHAKMPSQIKGIKLSGNVGHQKALLAGLHYVRGKADCAVSIDADLQDDIGAIEHMINAFQEGAEVVYGVRRHRDSDTRYKRWTAIGFYRVVRRLGVAVVENHADFRLLSSKVLECLHAFPETNVFLRGLIPLIGFKTAEVLYDRHSRVAGQSKYPLKKMLSLAWDGITSFSPAPLRMISLVGAGLFVLAVIASLYSLVQHLAGHTIVGWTSVVISIYMLGGIQLLAIGAIGEYLSKIYIEVKHRPQYFVECELP